VKKWFILLTYLAAFTVLMLIVFSTPAQQLLSTGPLSAEHGKISQCNSCHQPFGGTPQAKCLKCHHSIKKEIVTKVGVHATITKSCFTCHPEHQGGDLEKALSLGNFKHKDRFLFDGGHNEAKCSACHKKRGFKGLTNNCTECHTPEHNEGGGEKEEKLLSNNNCLACHFMTSWERLKINHSRTANCLQCHQEPANHFGKQCQTCHNTKDWEEVNFIHPNLPGEAGEEHSYRSFACVMCHPQGYEKYSCSSCHRKGEAGDDD